MGIQLQNEFTVPAPINEVWNFFQDPQKVAPCVPGAELNEIVDQNNYKGRVKVKMGPVSLSFKGTLTVLSRNQASHTITMKGVGGEEKGKGQAEAMVTAQMSGSGDSTQVRINQDINMSGAVAQYGRGMMSDVTTVLVNQMAKCLAGAIKGGGKAGPPKAASGFGIAAQSTAVGLKRIFGGGKK